MGHLWRHCGSGGSWTDLDGEAATGRMITRLLADRQPERRRLQVGLKLS